MRRLIDRFAKDANECSSIPELRSLIEDAASELGFSYFALVHHCAADGRQSSCLRLDNYPEGWLEERGQLVENIQDPVHQASRLTNVAFDWQEMGALVALTPGQRSILDLSRRFGLGQGLTVPANIPGEPAGSFSFVVRRGVQFPRHKRRCAEFVGAYAFNAARRLHGPKAFRRRPHLSKRELDCLRLVAVGKSDWETAKILGISFETVRQYMKRARTAYGVVTRTQLVVMGLRDDWIAADEVASEVPN